MEQRCNACGAPLIRKKCDYCGSKKNISGKDVDLSSHDAKFKRLAAKILPLIVVIPFIAIVIFGVLNREEIITVVCNGAPTLTTEAYGVTTIAIVEGTHYGRITRWIDQEIFPRQTFIDHYWGIGFTPSDDDIREWFEDISDGLLWEGTYWELVSIDEEFIITNFIYDYENMAIAVLDEIWNVSFNYVTRMSAIRGLEDRGAVCVEQ